MDGKNVPVGAISSVAVPCPAGSIGGRSAGGEGFVACLVDAIPVASRRVAHAAGAGRTGLVEIIAVGLALGKGGGVADGRLAAIPPQREKARAGGQRRGEIGRAACRERGCQDG